MRPFKYVLERFIFQSFMFMASLLGTNGLIYPQGAIIDHSCTDVSKIPTPWISQLKANIKLHYAHTSHGGQLTAGIEILAHPSSPVYDARLKYSLGFKSLPNSPDLCIMDGQLHDTYVVPEIYWRNGGELFTRSVLNSFPAINVSLWAWCTQLDSYSESEVKNYLETISRLEKEYPRVKFVYMTGNAQATSIAGYNRHLRNEQIRRYCRENNKILYDFGDLDAWFNKEQATYEFNGQRIPVEHPHFRGNEEAHTTYSSCVNKGIALWWLLAKIAGWDYSQDVESECDCNHDGRIDKDDFRIKWEEVLKAFLDWVKYAWGPSDPMGDVNEDGLVDQDDIREMKRILLKDMIAWKKKCGIK